MALGVSAFDAPPDSYVEKLPEILPEWGLAAAPADVAGGARPIFCELASLSSPPWTSVKISGETILTFAVFRLSAYRLRQGFSSEHRKD